jgi:sulfide dehydrogenase cytochrome subunit
MTSAKAVDRARGEALADGCTSCHGIRGASQGYIPSINHMSRAVFVRAMTEYRNQQRSATIMNRIARAYSPEEIELLADYFSESPP